MAGYIRAPSQVPPPYPNSSGKLPERSAAGGAFGASSAREGARIERERAQRERDAQFQAAAAGSNHPLNALTDEQREEINEAVRPSLL